MVEEKKLLKTRRRNARYGNREVVGGVPVAVIKSGKNTDFITAEEFVEDLYGREVDHIVFKDNSTSRRRGA